MGAFYTILSINLVCLLATSHLSSVDGWRRGSGCNNFQYLRGAAVGHSGESGGLHVRGRNCMSAGELCSGREPHLLNHIGVNR